MEVTFSCSVSASLFPSLTGEVEPQLSAQRLGDPQRHQLTDLIRAEHVNASPELGEVILPQTLSNPLRVLMETNTFSTQYNTKRSYREHMCDPGPQKQSFLELSIDVWFVIKMDI